MRKFFYDIALASFPVLLQIGSLFHKKARLMVDGRKNWEEKLSELKLSSTRVWFHCASLGEFEQGRPVIEQIVKSFPDHSIIVTFFSSSGFEIQKDYKIADFVCYLPFDGPKSSRKFIELLKPDLAVFVKYEFWYYYLTELKTRNIPTFSVSSIFRPEQHFFKDKGGFFGEMLKCFDHFFVQTENSKSLLNNIGIENVTVSGDTRFDRVIEICSKPLEVDVVKKFKVNDKVLVIGSSWPEDMEKLYPIINKSRSKLKFIIAPHEIEPAKIKNLLKGITANYQLFSSVDLTNLHEAQVLVIDNIGLLSSLYQYGEIAYVGGAFGEGLHNILEAATFGLPLIFGKGKDNLKYQEAIDLVNQGGAFEISHSQEIQAIVNRFLEDEAALIEVSDICKEYVQSKAGATNIIMDKLSKYLC